MGATFRTVQPTIRELVSASNDLRTSFEEQIGLDEIRNEFRTGASYSRPSTSYDPDAPGKSDATSHVSSQADGSSESASSDTQQDRSGTYHGTDFDVDIEAKRREAAKMAWGTATGSDAPVAKDSGNGAGTGARGALDGLSLEDLEAELARRKAARAGNGKPSA